MLLAAALGFVLALALMTLVQRTMRLVRARRHPVLGGPGKRLRRRRTDHLRLENEQLHAVLDAGRRLAARPDPAAAAQTLADDACRMTGADGAAVVLLDGTRGLVVARAGEGWAERLDPEDGVIGGVVGAAARLRCPVHRTATTDPLLPTTAHATLLCVPFFAQRTMTGAIVVARRERRGFDAAAESAARLLAGVAGPALDSARRHAETTVMAWTDPLTGLANRRRLDDDLRDLAGVLDRAAVAVAMVDVDHFKSYNDTYGHAAGDDALRRVAELVTRAVRSEDRVYRYGGEELTVLLPATPAADAVEVAERVRRIVRAGSALADRPVVTVSVGVAASTDGFTTPHELIAAADAALYDAKGQGRDRVVLAARRRSSSVWAERSRRAGRGGAPGQAT